MRRDTRPYLPYRLRITYYAHCGARRSVSYRVDAPNEFEASRVAHFRLSQDKRRNPARISATDIFLMEPKQ